MAARANEEMAVRESVMPKGVEHRGSGQFLISGDDVRKSVMPKGVEHP